MSKAGVSKRGNTDAIVEVKKRRKGNRTRWTTESYRAEIVRLTSGEYEVLGEYVNRRTSIAHRHTECLHEWNIPPDSIFRGNRCPKCSTRRLSQEEYLVRVRELWGDEYSVLSQYLGVNTPILHKHNKCGNEILIRPNSILRGNGCWDCAVKSRTKSQDTYLLQVFELSGKSYSVIDEYKASNVAIRHRHNECGHVWRVPPDGFLRGKRCPRCACNALKTSDKYREEVEENGRGEYSVLENYRGNRVPIMHHHRVCGHSWPTSPTNFIRGKRCPLCSASKGERRISNFLLSLNVPHKMGFPIDECRNIRPLPFDCAVLNKSNLILIEYDGIQHSRPVDRFRGEEGFKYIQQNDRIKTEYCRANGIPLIRIDYTQFDEIETILTEELTKLGVIGNRPTPELSAM